MNAKQIIETIKKLNFPKDQFLVVASGPIGIRNLRESGDIDLIVTPQLWHKLHSKHTSVIEGEVEKIKLNADVEILGPGSYFFNESVYPLKDMFEKADSIEGILFLNLNQLIDFKKKIGRKKDFKDIELIKKYLEIAQINN